MHFSKKLSPPVLRGIVKLSGSYTRIPRSSGICLAPQSQQLRSPSMHNAALPPSILAASSFKPDVLHANGGSASLHTWGQAEHGKLAFGEPTQSILPVEQLSPVQPKLFGTPQSVNCGGAHTMYIDSDGAIWAAGENTFGQLGLGDTEHRWVFDRVNLPSSAMKAAGLAGGHFHTLARLEDGRVLSFGQDKVGQLGQGTAQKKCPNPRVIEALEGVSITQVAAGAQHSMALTSHGDVYTWGSSWVGQLGHGFQEDEPYPRRVDTLIGQRVVAIFAGFESSAAITDEGHVWMWGSNSLNQLGLGPKTRRDFFLPVVNKYLKGQFPVSLALGKSHGAAISSHGQVMMWGSGGQAGLGFGYEEQRSADTPVPIKSMSTLSCRQAVCGDSFTLLLTGQGQVYSWGWGAGGRLGLGDEFDYWEPQLIAALPAGQRMLSAGSAHAAAI